MLDSRNCIYQIVTDRFYNGNPDKQMVNELCSQDKSNLRKYLGGDWEGIICKIKDGYLTGLGVTAILISQPVENVHTCMEDEQGTASYHGYWPRDFAMPNSYFGSMEKFQELVRIAHKNSLKVLIDFTPNHTSPAQELRPGYMENGALYHQGEMVATYSRDMERVFLHNGGTDFQSYENSLYRNLYDLAGLDQLHPKVDQILREGIQFWLEQGVDGIRIDAAKHIPPGWLKSFTGYIQSKTQAFIFGEWFLLEHEHSQLNAPFANESGMSLLHFMYTHSLREVLLNKGSFECFVSMLMDSSENYKWAMDQVIFLDNHDMTRFTKEAHVHLTDIALCLLLTSVGIPLLYYGTEQYMTGGSDPDNRKMMSSFSQNTSAYRIIARLNALRVQNVAACYGELKILYLRERILVFERTYLCDVIVVMINLYETAETITDIQTSLPAGRYKSWLETRFADQEIRVDILGLVSGICLQALSVCVYSFVSESIDTISITHFYPRVVTSGSKLVIQGRQLGDRGGTVSIGNQFGEVFSWCSERIVVILPTLLAGEHSIRITTRQGLESNVLEGLKVLTAVPVTVRLIVRNAFTEYDSQVYLSGNVFELGEWEISRAIGPFFNHVVYRYPTWYYDVSLPAGQRVELKLFKKYESGIVVWEAGLAHNFITPNEGVGELIVDWQS